MEATYSELQEDAAQFLKKECWGVAVGGNGTVIDLHFGRKLPRNRPILNDKICPDLRVYRGEFGLMIYCAWRLQSNKSILLGCWDLSVPEKVSQAVDYLVGQRVVEVRMVPVSLDMHMIFESGIQLTIFCDQSELAGTCANYVLFGLERNITVQTGWTVTKSPRAQSAENLSE